MVLAAPFLLCQKRFLHVGSVHTQTEEENVTLNKDKTRRNGERSAFSEAEDDLEDFYSHGSEDGCANVHVTSRSIWNETHMHTKVLFGMTKGCNTGKRKSR